MINITINGKSCEAEEGATIIGAAAAAGIYIPTVCHHPDLPPFKDLPLASRVFRGDSVHENEAIPKGEPRPIGNPKSPISEVHHLEGCGLCVVEVEGFPEPARACQTSVASGMNIHTEGETLEALRRGSLMRILARHPHACLTCAQREGCSLEDCSSNVPKDERCCSQFHNCELRKVAKYVGVKEETPRYRPAGLPVLNGEPLIARDFNLCIDCARCVRVCNQVRGVDALGIVHNNERLVVGSVAATLIESSCKFCGACVEVCPTGCLTDTEVQTGARAQWLVPCMGACPAGLDVPGYIRRIAGGDFPGAAALVWERLPLANVLGHICFHLCEYECRRGKIDEPLAICALKRFSLEASDGVSVLQMAKAASTDKSVAVIGAGPAGLGAAYFLRLKGHAVTIFEASPSPGGMPALSVPEYRLPEAVLEKDLAAIRKLGVAIETGHRVPDGEAMVNLKNRGFDAVLIAVGLASSRKIALEGNDLAGVLWGLEFLREVKAGQTFDLGREIVVIGGGNVAIDVAMTALRLSRATVRLLCLERREQMPAHAHEIEQALAEGIEINPGWGPAAILGAEGRVKHVVFQRCLAVLDDRGEFAPTFDDRQSMTVEADAVILAIGQEPPGDLPTEGEGVFLAGDITGGPMSVVHAVASGRGAAERIDKYLGGDGDVTLRLGDGVAPDAWIGREEGFAPRPRVAIPCGSPEQRRTGFGRIERTYSAQDAIAEAKRCLQCDLRLAITQPTLPPETWVEFTRSNVDQVPAVEGVYVLADADKKATVIKGTANIRVDLLEKLPSQGDTRFFHWEEDRMYTKRESELIQQHLSRYGELPGGGDEELDDLF